MRGDGKGMPGLPKKASGEKPCEECGEIMLTYPWIKCQRWCSLNCRTQWHRSRDICYRCRRRKVSPKVRGAMCRQCSVGLRKYYRTPSGAAVATE